MDLKEIGVNTRNWVGSTQDRDYWKTLVNVILNLVVPYAMKLVSSLLSDVYYYFDSQGHDTTSAGMSWALFLLGLHPDVQVKAYLDILT